MCFYLSYLKAKYNVINCKLVGCRVCAQWSFSKISITVFIWTPLHVGKPAQSTWALNPCSSQERFVNPCPRPEVDTVDWETMAPHFRIKLFQKKKQNCFQERNQSHGAEGQARNQASPWSHAVLLCSPCMPHQNVISTPKSLSYYSFCFSPICVTLLSRADRTLPA